MKFYKAILREEFPKEDLFLRRIRANVDFRDLGCVYIIFVKGSTNGVCGNLESADYSTNYSQVINDALTLAQIVNINKALSIVPKSNVNPRLNSAFGNNGNITNPSLFIPNPLLFGNGGEQQFVSDFGQDGFKKQENEEETKDKLKTSIDDLPDEIN